MPQHPGLVAAYRLAVAVLTSAALAFTAYRSALTGTLANFFSFFTIESNILGTLVFFAGAYAYFAGRAPVPDLLRGAAALYLLITGVVYGVALAHYDTPQVIPWVNTVVHRVTPLVFVLDWLIDPPRRSLGYRRAAAAWLIFPALFLIYTLVRGPVAQWYPYPFLDPRQHGYRRVAVSCVVVALAFAAAAALLSWGGTRLGARRSTTSTAVKPAHSQH